MLERPEFRGIAKTRLFTCILLIDFCKQVVGVVFEKIFTRCGFIFCLSTNKFLWYVASFQNCAAGIKLSMTNKLVLEKMGLFFYP